MSEKELDGRHVVVTGAGTGIGEAIALRLGREGATLSLMGRRVELLEQTAWQVREGGGKEPLVVGVDVCDGESVRVGFAKARETNGDVWGLVANAGLGGGNASGEGDRFFELVETNLSGTYRCCRAAEGDGLEHVVVIASVLARIGVPGYTGYCASKAGLLGLVRALAMELAPGGGQVNAVCPGWVNTEMAREGLEGMSEGMGVSFDEAKRVAMGDVPLGRMSEPGDVAGLVRWLLSGDARGVTGQGVDMNGGAWM